jgi:hypothetical protein
MVAGEGVGFSENYENRYMSSKQNLRSNLGKNEGFGGLDDMAYHRVF